MNVDMFLKGLIWGCIGFAVGRALVEVLFPTIESGVADLLGLMDWDRNPPKQSTRIIIALLVWGPIIASLIIMPFYWRP